MSDALAPYAALVAVAEAEVVLAAAGRLDELAALQDEWSARLAALPASAPSEARPLLERALALQSAAAQGLRDAAGEVSAQLGQLDRARTSARGYAPVAGDPARAVDRAA